MKPLVNIIEAIADPNIIGDSLSVAQQAALKAVYGLQMNQAEQALAREMSGRAANVGAEQREAVFICGRRSGKSDKLAANIAIFEAFFRSHDLSPGETGVVLLLAQNMRQAKVVKGYIEGKIYGSPVLRRHVKRKRAQELELDNRITIAIHPASFRSIRGLSVVCCICDEIAFWWTEDNYANPDVEVVRAVRPAMATFPHGKLVMVSSPYTMTGVLWDAWKKRDKDPHTLVWHAPTRLMNPTVPESFLKREQTRDPENYRREYEAEFTEAISSFLPAEAIDACVVEERKELPPDRQIHNYVAAVDAAFKGDRFTMAIGHLDRSRGAVVMDMVTGWQGSKKNPLRMGEVMPQIKAHCERFAISQVLGDQFGAEPLKDAFAKNGLRYEERTFTNKSKADIYATLRTRIMDRTIELLDHNDSLKELRGLELERLPGGGIRIGHAKHAGAHDDYADSMALVVSEASQHIEAACPIPVDEAGDLELMADYGLSGNGYQIPENIHY